MGSCPAANCAVIQQTNSSQAPRGCLSRLVYGIVVLVMWDVSSAAFTRWFSWAESLSGHRRL